MPELIPFCVALKHLRVLPLHGMLVHHKVTVEVLLLMLSFCICPFVPAQWCNYILFSINSIAFNSWHGGMA